MPYVRFRPRKLAWAGTGGESSRCRSRRRGACASYISVRWLMLEKKERRSEKAMYVLEFALESKFSRPRCQWYAVYDLFWYWQIKGQPSRWFWWRNWMLLFLGTIVVLTNTYLPSHLYKTIQVVYNRNLVSVSVTKTKIKFQYRFRGQNFFRLNLNFLPY